MPETTHYWDPIYDSMKPLSYHLEMWTPDLPAGTIDIPISYKLHPDWVGLSIYTRLDNTFYLHLNFQTLPENARFLFVDISKTSLEYLNGLFEGVALNNPSDLLNKREVMDFISYVKTCYLQSQLDSLDTPVFLSSAPPLEEISSDITSNPNTK